MRSKIHNSSFAAAGLLLSFFTAFSASADDVWDGYTRLGWFETDGSNWIDTGVKARSGLILKATVKMLSVDPNQAVLGGSDANDANGIGLVTRPTITSAWNQMRVIYGGFNSATSGSYTWTYTTSSAGPHQYAVFNFNNGSFSLYSTTYSSLPAVVSGHSFESQANIFLGWMGGPGPNGGSTDYAPAPLLVYAFDIQDKTSGAYLRQLLPARRNSDGEIGMLDVANGVFYGHQGARPFINGREYSSVHTTAFQSTGKTAELTVSGYTGSSTLSNIPLLVKISSSTISGFSYSDTLANGADVFFSSDPYGIERLACDVDTWDTSGTSLVWVKIPTLSGKNTKLYMFWGSGSAATRPSSTEVWSGYVAVWHMNSYDPATGVRDETGHGFNFTNETGSTTAAYSGQFGAALKLVNATDSTLGGRLFAPNFDRYITAEAVTNLMPEVITVSAWYKKPDGIKTSSWDDIIDKYIYAESELFGVSSPKVRYGWLWQMPNDIASMSFHYASGTSSQSLRPTSMSSAQTTWIYAAQRSDGYNHKYLCYYTGAMRKSGTGNTGVDRNKAFGKTYKPVRLGATAKPTAIDEVRISREVLTDDRLLADYLMMHSGSFVTASAAHTAYSGVVEVSGSPENYGSSVIQYGADLDVTGTPKTYTVPAAVEVTGADHRAVCDGWELEAVAIDGSTTLERTSENPLAGEDDCTCIVTPHEKKSLKWLWHEEYLLTLSSADSTMGAVPASAWYGTNTVQTVTPIPEEGYFFYCWTGDTDGMDVFSTTIPMDRPRALVATFRPNAELSCEFSCPTNTSAAVDFMDAQYWANGRLPNALASQVAILMPPEGVTNKINVSSQIHVASLDVGAGEGGGRIEITISHKAENSVSGDVRLRPNTYVTHELGGYKNAKLDVKYKVNFSVGGDMTIDAGASINVSAKGHITNQGPTGSISYNNPDSGAPHGGKSNGSNYSAYDSAQRPQMYGAAFGSYGGGVVRLSVAGTLTVNGVVVAGSKHGTSYCSGAGGAIWIDAGVLAGAGTISATAGDSMWGKSGCGGRIAVYLTNPSATDFSAFTGSIQACGGRSYDTTGAASDGRQAGAAGTVYLQAYGETPTSATLIIDNERVATSSKNTAVTSGLNSVTPAAIYIPYTPLSDEYDCGEIGNIIVRNGGNAEIGSRTFKVHKGITVDNARFKAYSGTIELCGTEETTIMGTGTYCSVSCTVPGKTLKFGTGAHDNFRIADGATLTLKGSSEDPLVLKPAVAGETWKVSLAPTAESEVKYVTVDHSDASGGIAITAHSSTDGGSNVNWSFPLPMDPGDTLTWNGTFSGLWSDVANWTDKHGRPRLPVETDVIVIPAGCDYYPAIKANTLQNSIVVAQGASLELTNGARLDVTNAFTVAGTFTVIGTEPVFFSGRSLDFSGGVVNMANSTFNIIGDVDATLDFGGNTVRRLYFRKTGGIASFTGSVGAETFDALATNAVTLAFAEGVTLSAKNVYCRSRAEAGAADSALMTLRGIVEGETWNLSATHEEHFSGVKVRDSAATALNCRADALSVNLGGNSNWTFGTSAAEWIGGTGDFDVAANWYPAAVPGASTDVLISGINGASAATASGNVTVRSVKVGPGTAASSLTVNGVLTTSLDVVVETNATLTLNSPLADNVVGRDFIVRMGGKATHTALPSTCDTLEDADTSGYRFRIDVARDVVVDAGGAIDVSGRGYQGGGDQNNPAGKGPLGYMKSFDVDTDGDGIDDATLSNASAGHAGYSTWNANLYRKTICYGSMFEPVTHGSGGLSGCPGGGVVLVKCARNAVVNGTVAANGIFGSGYGFSGAGGSVWIDVEGTLSGSGVIVARGGTVPHDAPAGGGRVALYFGEDAFEGVVSASTAAYTSNSRGIVAGSGTVLRKCKSSAHYDVAIDYDQYKLTSQYSDRGTGIYWNTFVTDGKMNSTVTDIPSLGDMDKISLFKKVRFSLGHLTAMNLTQDLKIEDLNVTVNTGCYVRLNYHTLRVLSGAHKNAKGWAGASVERSTRDRGEIIWGAGFAVTVR